MRCAIAINLSPRIRLIYARSCCRISEHLKFKHSNDLPPGKDHIVAFGNRRFPSRNKQHLKSNADFKKMIDDINVIIANMGGMAINTDKKTSNHLMSSNVSDVYVSRKIITLSIQTRILEMEAHVTANKPILINESPLLIVKNLNELPFTFEYVANRWSLIFQQKNNPRVNQLIALMIEHDVRPNQFCQAMSYIFCMSPTINCKIPPFTELKFEEVEYCLRHRFRFNRVVNLLLKCVSIMKVY